MTYVRYENYTSARARKSTEQKSTPSFKIVFEINGFVKKLTENLNESGDVSEVTDTKFKALRKII